MIILTDVVLYTPTVEIKKEDFEKVFLSALKIKEWIKTKPAYAVAANQLGFNESFFVVHRKYKKWGLPTDLYFNPTYSPVGEIKVLSKEKCLSYPGEEFEIERFEKIKLKYYDPWYKEDNQVTLSGLAAIVVQHEISHLQGIDERKLDLQSKKS